MKRADVVAIASRDVSIDFLSASCTLFFTSSLSELLFGVIVADLFLDSLIVGKLAVPI